MREEPLKSRSNTTKKTIRAQANQQINCNKSVVQKYSIKDEVSFGKNSLGKKIEKNILVGTTPAFSLIKKAIL